ncbi:MAG: EboA domain-containing protein [Rhodospirillales bacterium]
MGDVLQLSVDLATIEPVLRGWVTRQGTVDAVAWLSATADRIAAGDETGERALFVALGLVPRRLGKADLALTADDLAAADAARPGWDPRGWSLDQAGRLLLLLARAARPGFTSVLEQLFVTADVSELVTFYRGLPLYPDPAAHVARAEEGARSNMKAVFEAVAQRNPYPAERFSEAAWNHLVLKALFVESTLDPIQGLDARQNPELARMLCDYAHERWAAGRKVSWELWRCVGRFADEAAIADLARVLASADAHERAAAALALAASPRADARALLDAAGDLGRDARAGRLGWAALAAAPTS